MMGGVDLSRVELKNAIKDRTRLIQPAEDHQNPAKHCVEPDANIETKGFAIGLGYFAGTGFAACLVHQTFVAFADKTQVQSMHLPQGQTQQTHNPRSHTRTTIMSQFC